MKYLVIRCEECGEEYIVNYEKCQTKQLRILDFAICPNGHPRRPYLHENYMKGWVCKKCGVPSPFVKAKNKDICEPCYYTLWYHSKVAKRRQVVKLDN